MGFEIKSIFTQMKNFIIFKGNQQQSDISRKIKFREICNLWGFDLQKYFPDIFWKELERIESN